MELQKSGQHQSTANMPASRMQVWLSRGGLVVCIVMLILLRTVGLGDVTSVHDGDTTTYSGSLHGLVYFGVSGILVSAIAVVFWMHPSRLFTVFSIALFALAIFVFINVPTGLNHRVIVTPDHVHRRVGAWYLPVEHHVVFENVYYLQLGETQPNRDGSKAYELQCYTKPDGDIVAIPVFDMMKKALPEIFERAAARGVVIGENVD